MQSALGDEKHERSEGEIFLSALLSATMEFHQLRDFVAVAKAGSFSRAAAACRVAQPSLSKAVQRLEAEMGEQLIIRSRHRALLTEAGKTLLPSAMRILDEVEDTKRQFRDRRGLRQGHVSIGILPTISPYLLPQVLPGFVKSYPGLKLGLLEETTEELLKMVETGELDLAVLCVPLTRAGFESETLFREELVLVTPATHPLLQKDSISLADLNRERFILMCEGHSMVENLHDNHDRDDPPPGITFKSAQAETLRLLVAAGLGVALVPRMSAIERAALAFLPLAEPKPTRTIAVVWQRGREKSRVASEFLAHLKQAVKAFRNGDKKKTT